MSSNTSSMSISKSKDSSKSKSKNEQTLDEKYQQKTDKEHILDNPDTYIGSIENVSGPMYIYDEKIIQKDIDYNPALYKLFDEGITNCRDHRVRTEQKKLVDDTTDVVTNASSTTTSTSAATTYTTTNTTTTTTSTIDTNNKQ